MLELYDNPQSPFAFKVRVALYEKGAEFTAHELHRADQREELLAINPRGEVPTLVDGDCIIGGSSVICAYLEDCYPDPPLLPADPKARARCRSLEQLSDGPVDGAVFSLVALKAFWPGLGDEYPEALAQAEAHMQHIFDTLNTTLGDREYFCGDFTVADAALAPQLSAAVFFGCAPGDALGGWLARITTRRSVQQAFQKRVEALQIDEEEPNPYFSRDRFAVRDHRLEWVMRSGLGDWLRRGLERGTLFYRPVP